MRIALGRPDPLDIEKRRDGIDIYATQLAAALRASGQGLDVVECWYPRGIRANGCAAAFAAPFALSTAAALVLGRTPGACYIEREANVFHATDYRIPRLRRVPVVATLHDAVAIDHPAWTPRAARPRAHMARVVAKWAQRVICVSNIAAAEVTAAFRLPERIVRVVYPGVHDIFFAQDDSLHAADLLDPALANRRYFLFVGKIQPRKNLERVLAAHRSLPRELRLEHPLLVVGRQGWACEDVCRQLAAYSKDGFAHWLGDVPYERMPAIYRHAVALVFPSLHEGFGLPLVEAFATRTPVVASTAGALPEVAGDAALLVEPLDIGEIGAAMRLVAYGSREIEAKVEAGARRAREFTWHWAAARTLKVYRELG